jgi:hypothetical protein
MTLDNKQDFNNWIDVAWNILYACQKFAELEASLKRADKLDRILTLLSNVHEYEINHN